MPNIDVDSVGLIIGQNVPEALVPREVVTGPYGASYAVKTLLGWTINGPIGKGPVGVATCGVAYANFVHADMSLDQQVERFWKIDSIESPCGGDAALSVDDKRLSTYGMIPQNTLMVDMNSTFRSNGLSSIYLITRSWHDNDSKVCVED